MDLTKYGLKFLLIAGVSSIVAACATPDAGDGEGEVAEVAPPPVEAAPPPPPPPPAIETQSLAIYAGDRVYFDYDSSELNDETRETLQKQADWMTYASHAGVGFVIEGHCDERGTRDYNLALGERRANAVKNYLVGLGVNPDRLNTVSYGKERPVDPRSTADAWAKNRRSVTTLATPGV